MIIVLDWHLRIFIVIFGGNMYSIDKAIYRYLQSIPPIQNNTDPVLISAK